MSQMMANKSARRLGALGILVAAATLMTPLGGLTPAGAAEGTPTSQPAKAAADSKPAADPKSSDPKSLDPKAAAGATDLAKETARLSQIAFESGAGTSLDLIDSGRVLRQAELDLAVKELSVVQAKIAALLAMSACDI